MKKILFLIILTTNFYNTYNSENNSPQDPYHAFRLFYQIDKKNLNNDTPSDNEFLSFVVQNQNTTTYSFGEIFHIALEECFDTITFI